MRTDSSAAERMVAEVAVKLMRVAALLESDPAAAARDAAQILSEHPGDRQAALLLGTAQRNAGDLAAASAVFAQLAAEQPEAAPIQYELGRVLAAQGRGVRLAALVRMAQITSSIVRMAEAPEAGGGKGKMASKGVVAAMAALGVFLF